MIKTISDYIDDVQKDFPELSKTEVRDILNYGFRVFYDRTRKGCDIKIGCKDYKAWCKRMVPPERILEYKREVNDRKLHTMWRGRREFEGFYYFTLSDKEFNDLGPEKLTTSKEITFPKLYLYKLKEECHIHRHKKRHWFRLEYPLDVGWFMYKENYKTNKYEYLGDVREENLNKSIRERNKHGLKSKCHTQYIVDG